MPRRSEPAPSPHQGPDFYQLLSVPRDATATTITHAYRRQARVLHPDSRPQDSGATERFRAVAEAYRVLNDPARRAQYDRALHDRALHDRAVRRRDSSGDSGEIRVQSAPPVQGPPTPPLWPLGPAQVTRTTASGSAALWAAPVHVDPPARLPGAYAAGADRELAELIRLLISRWDRPW